MNNQPQAVYTKEGSSSVPPTLPTATMATPSSVGTNTPLRKTQRKFLGMSLKTVGIVGGLLSFLIIGGAILLTTGILQKKESVAPTLPKAAEDLSCTLAFTVTAAPTPSPTPTPTVTPSPSPTATPTPLDCNSSCNPDNDLCDEANDNYYCSVTYGNRCRHADYPAEEDCQSSTPAPTPAPGCNDTCETSSDCANPDHICFETSNGKRCRLDEYPWSSSCVKPAGIVEQRVYTPGTQVVEEVVTQEQPVLPEQLPETGVVNALKWSAGFGAATAAGALLLLLLM